MPARPTFWGSLVSAGPSDPPPSAQPPPILPILPILARGAAFAVALAALAWALPSLALRLHPSALVLNLGPNDAAYVQGFRSDWERDGRTRFRWTTQSAAIRLPVRLTGDGFRLRMRIRRHLPDPAFVRLTAEGRTVDSFEIRPDEKTPYRTLDKPLQTLMGQWPFALLIECESTNPRPLGMAVDWLEIIPAQRDSQVHLNDCLMLWIVAVVLATFLALRLSGAPAAVAALGGSLVAVLIALGVAKDVLATDRIVREGGAFYTGVAALCILLTRWARSSSALDVSSRLQAAVLSGAALGAAILRLVLVLHPQFYYPDVGIHAVFAGRLAGGGLPSFLQEFTANQFRFSLGLQMENGHWYAFPYPPAFYLACWPFIRPLGFRPEVVVSALPAALNSLEVFVTFALVRRLGLSPRVALGAAAGAHPLLPIFLVRLGLAYFPALFGHTLDMLVLLYLLAHLRSLGKPSAMAALGSLIALALLGYTQSVLNLGILLPVFLLADFARDRSPLGRARQRGLLVAGLLGVTLSTAVFYGRYFPVFLDMRRGVPQTEEQILLDKLAKAPVSTEELVPDEIDPYTGPTLDLWRGARKAVARMTIFYGAFAPAILFGVLWSFRSAPATEARLLAVWATTYLILNLASGGLPGPNLVRYNKDLEIVAPLCCLGLAQAGCWLWDRSRVLGVLFGGGYGYFGFGRGVRALTEKFVFER